jgi:hypothetical protein
MELGLCLARTDNHQKRQSHSAAQDSQRFKVGRVLETSPSIPQGLSALRFERFVGLIGSGSE